MNAAKARMSEQPDRGVNRASRMATGETTRSVLEHANGSSSAMLRTRPRRTRNSRGNDLSDSLRQPLPSRPALRRVRERVGQARGGSEIVPSPVGPRRPAPRSCHGSRHRMEARPDLEPGHQGQRTTTEETRRGFEVLPRLPGGCRWSRSFDRSWARESTAAGTSFEGSISPVSGGPFGRTEPRTVTWSAWGREAARARPGRVAESANT